MASLTVTVQVRSAASAPTFVPAGAVGPWTFIVTLLPRSRSTRTSTPWYDRAGRWTLPVALRPVVGLGIHDGSGWDASCWAGGRESDGAGVVWSEKEQPASRPVAVHNPSTATWQLTLRMLVRRPRRGVVRRLMFFPFSGGGARSVCPGLHR